MASELNSELVRMRSMLDAVDDEIDWGKCHDWVMDGQSGTEQSKPAESPTERPGASSGASTARVETLAMASEAVQGPVLSTDSSFAITGVSTLSALDDVESRGHVQDAGRDAIQHPRAAEEGTVQDPTKQDDCPFPVGTALHHEEQISERILIDQ